ncbi:hypothetical protein ACQP2P_28795 [Dactylosporangium sp. CA-139114]|uniref:hypothetical protein n=1 Tax=Dactylosporangium sp. CA-139114 TaxID=3239931 RepID=UPI003D95B769
MYQLQGSTDDGLAGLARASQRLAVIDLARDAHANWFRPEYPALAADAQPTSAPPAATTATWGSRAPSPPGTSTGSPRPAPDPAAGQGDTDQHHWKELAWHATSA